MVRINERKPFQRPRAIRTIAVGDVLGALLKPRFAVLSHALVRDVLRDQLLGVCGNPVQCLPELRFHVGWQVRQAHWSECGPSAQRLG